jgi:hypothetical protein
MTSRVEQHSYLVGCGIDARQIGAFVKVAVNARKSEIVHVIEAAVLLGDDMLDMESSKR